LNYTCSSETVLKKLNVRIDRNREKSEKRLHKLNDAPEKYETVKSVRTYRVRRKESDILPKEEGRNNPRFLLSYHRGRESMGYAPMDLRHLDNGLTQAVR